MVPRHEKERFLRAAGGLGYVPDEFEVSRVLGSAGPGMQTYQMFIERGTRSWSRGFTVGQDWVPDAVNELQNGTFGPPASERP